MTGERMSKLIQGYGASYKMVHTTLTRVCSSQRSWSGVTKLLEEEMKKEQVRLCEMFVAIIAWVPEQSF
jgi:hypothetical protein